MIGSMRLFFIHSNELQCNSNLFIWHLKSALIVIAGKWDLMHFNTLIMLYFTVSHIIMVTTVINQLENYNKFKVDKRARRSERGGVAIQM